MQKPKAKIQPKAKMQPKAPGEWTTGLWGCFSDWGNCITTLFCPCITYGQIANIVQKGKTSVFTEARNYATIMYFTGGCCLYSCFSRSKLRHKYNLPQSPCSLPDCAVQFCCELCALCQEYRELQGRGFNMAIGKLASSYAQIPTPYICIYFSNWIANMNLNNYITVLQGNTVTVKCKAIIT
ncbi:hypothetical protein DCAR_0314240 [Daucus carota subsp. sativus]|uniref:Uncharacterized protein n=1 Tax=Daucus carota subsp. sativus TaxID=79200 RepID=A0AAF0WUP1_DAUCS|nr:hypothetical protein DCAR_0314240 [Daucus carota subsp. sativus]